MTLLILFEFNDLSCLILPLAILLICDLFRSKSPICDKTEFGKGQAQAQDRWKFQSSKRKMHSSFSAFILLANLSISIGLNPHLILRGTLICCKYQSSRVQ
jgi:hypothetical protein